MTVVTATDRDHFLKDVQKVVNDDYFKFMPQRMDMAPVLLLGPVTQKTKYVRIYINENDHRSVWGFINLEDTGKFKAGDLLKADGWKTPALNFARGNIFDNASFSCCKWTGVL